MNSTVSSQAFDAAAHSRRVTAELKAAGASPLIMWRSSVRYLPQVIHPEEHIEAVAHGLRNGSFVLLVATDERIVYLDKKWLATIEDEESYPLVYGVSFNRSAMQSTVILHTHIDDYKITSFNQEAMRRFTDYIERRCVDSQESLFNGYH